MKEKMETEYLGTIKTGNGKNYREINNRVQKNKICILPKRNKKVGKEDVSNYTKMRMHKTIYLPPISWATLKVHESRITGAEMRYFGKCMEKYKKR